MPSSPWKWHRQASPDREYLVLLSFLPLRRFSRVPWFLLHTLRIARQLAAARGLVGYSLNAEPLAKRFWTLSVWEDDAALRAFAGTPPHAQAMRVMAPHMRPTAFVRWTLTGSALPPTWADALGRAGGSRPTAG
jgi:quinol monooxygenase YgiN